MVKFLLIEGDSSDDESPLPDEGESSAATPSSSHDIVRRTGHQSALRSTARERERDRKIEAALSDVVAAKHVAAAVHDVDLAAEHCNAESPTEVVVESNEDVPPAHEDDALVVPKRNLRALPATDQNHLRRRTINANRQTQANALLEVPLDKKGNPLVGTTHTIVTNRHHPKYQHHRGRGGRGGPYRGDHHNNNSNKRPRSESAHGEATPHPTGRGRGRGHH